MAVSNVVNPGAPNPARASIDANADRRYRRSENAR